MHAILPFFFFVSLLLFFFHSVWKKNNNHNPRMAHRHKLKPNPYSRQWVRLKTQPKMNKTTQFMILIHVFNPKICSHRIRFGFWVGFSTTLFSSSQMFLFLSVTETLFFRFIISWCCITNKKTTTTKKYCDHN